MAGLGIAVQAIYETVDTNPALFRGANSSASCDHASAGLQIGGLVRTAPASALTRNTSAVSATTLRPPPKTMVQKLPFDQSHFATLSLKLRRGSDDTCGEMNSSARLIQPPFPPARVRAYLRDAGRLSARAKVIIPSRDTVGVNAKCSGADRHRPPWSTVDYGLRADHAVNVDVAAPFVRNSLCRIFTAFRACIDIHIENTSLQRLPEEPGDAVVGENNASGKSPRPARASKLPHIVGNPDMPITGRYPSPGDASCES